MPAPIGQTLDLNNGKWVFANASEPSLYTNEDSRPTMSFVDTLRALVENSEPGVLAQGGSLSDYFTELAANPNPTQSVPGYVAYRAKDPAFMGYSQGSPVYYDPRLIGSRSEGETARSTIHLNPLLTTNAGDVLRHETGHASIQRMLPETPAAQEAYNSTTQSLDQASEAYKARNSGVNAEAVDKAYKAYLVTPQEQGANWLGKVYGSWSNDPTENPPIVNQVFDLLTKLNQEAYRIETMFDPPPASAKRATGMIE